MIQLTPCAVIQPSSLPSGPWLAPWFLLANTEEYLGLGRLVADDQGKRWLMQDGRTLQMSDVVYWSHLYSPSKVAQARPAFELLDEDGYPTEGALGLLSDWPWADPVGWLALAEQLWSYPERFVRTEHPEYVEYRMSTGGWSGNEGVLAAMQKNAVLWGTCWDESTRGGHTVFRLKRRGVTRPEKAAQ